MFCKLKKPILLFFIYIILSLCCVVPLNTRAQLFYTEPVVNTDSLEKVLNKAEGLNRLVILNKLSNAYRINDPDRAIDLAKESYNLAYKLKDSTAIMKSN
jgi:hypothetical protein